MRVLVRKKGTQENQNQEKICDDGSQGLRGGDLKNQCWLALKDGRRNHELRDAGGLRT